MLLPSKIRSATAVVFFEKRKQIDIEERAVTGQKSLDCTIFKRIFLQRSRNL